LSFITRICLAQWAHFYCALLLLAIAFAATAGYSCTPHFPMDTLTTRIDELEGESTALSLPRALTMMEQAG